MVLFTEELKSTFVYRENCTFTKHRNLKSLLISLENRVDVIGVYSVKADEYWIKDSEYNDDKLSEYEDRAGLVFAYKPQEDDENLRLILVLDEVYAPVYAPNHTQEIGKEFDEWYRLGQSSLPKSKAKIVVYESGPPLF